MRKGAELLSACHHAVMSSCRHVIIPSCCHINHWQLWYIWQPWQLWTTLDYLWQLPAALANLTTSANLPSILGVSWQLFWQRMALFRRLSWYDVILHHVICLWCHLVIFPLCHLVILSLCCHVILSSCHLPWCGICDLLILPAPSPNASQPWSLSVFQLAHLRACELVSNSQSTGVGIILSSQFTGMDHFEFTIQPSCNPIQSNGSHFHSNTILHSNLFPGKEANIHDACLGLIRCTLSRTGPGKILMMMIPITMMITRSLGALRAPTSSLRPFGPPFGHSSIAPFGRSSRVTHEPLHRARMHHTRMHRTRMHRARMHRTRMHRTRMHRTWMYHIRMHPTWMHRIWRSSSW